MNLKMLSFISLALSSCVSDSSKKLDQKADVLPQATGLIDIDPHAGLIWMPLVWRLTQKKDLAKLSSSFTFKSPLLVFEEMKTKHEVCHKLWLSEEREEVQDFHQLIHLNAKNPAQELVSSAFFKLPEGNYRLKAIRLYYLDDKQQASIIQLPAPHPFSQEEDQPLEIKSQANQIGLVGRLIIQTELKRTQTGLFSASHAYQIDQQQIPLHFFNEFTGQPLEAAKVYDATDKYNRIIIPVSALKNQHLVRSGLRVVYPCHIKEEIALTLLWEQERDSRLFSIERHLKAVPSRQSYCEVFFSFQLPQGSWNLFGVDTKDPLSSQSHQKKFFQVLTPLARQYLRVQQSPQHKPSKPLSLLNFQFDENVTGNFKDIQFLGTIALSEKENFFSPQFFKSFDVKNLQRGFQTDRLINAYNGSLLTRSKKKGSIKVHLTSQQIFSEKHGLKNLQRSLSKSLSDCVQQLEISDPLLVFQGDFQIEFREDQRGRITEKTLSSDLSSQQKLNLTTCLNHKLYQTSFQTSASLPLNFHLQVNFQ
jgi:hypothetical protein